MPIGADELEKVMEKVFFERRYFLRFCDLYYIEKKMRKLDGKKRLIKNPNRVANTVWYRKWILDTDDEMYQEAEQRVFDNLFKKFKDDDKIQKNVVRWDEEEDKASLDIMRTWCAKHFKKTVKETIRSIKLP